MKEPESGTGAMIVSRGIGIDVWKDVDSVFVPLLKKSMTDEERRTAVREVVRRVGAVDDKLNLVAGEMLFEVHSNEYWRDWITVDEESGEERPFKSFSEWCETEANMRERKAYYLLSIYRVFCVELDIPLSVLRDLEWPKASLLAAGRPPIITADNWEELLTKIKTMTAPQVREMVRLMRGGASVSSAATGGREAEPPARATGDDLSIRRTFVLTKEQALTVDESLRLAGSMAASDKPGWLLELICADFLASSAGAGPKGALIKLDMARRCLERAFGVRMEIVEIDGGGDEEDAA